MEGADDEFWAQRAAVTFFGVIAEGIIIWAFFQFIVPQIDEWFSMLCSVDATGVPSYQNGFLAALIAAIASVLVAWPIALIVTRRTARRKYEYGRSTHTTRARFKREIAGIQRLSCVTYEMTRYLEKQPSPLPKGGRGSFESEWSELSAKAIKTLGESAPFLYYLDDKTHEKTCGCLDCLSVYIKEGRNERMNMFERAEGLLEKLEDRKGALESGSGSPTAKEVEEAYKEFVQCAWCRFSYIETGKKDSKRIEFVKSLPVHRFCNYILDQFSHKCCPSAK